ncbi:MULTISPECIES: hypothetical protein [Shewanella]|uniref:hypothetical protein n=1 Tax=Shewanella TaxID=22 RepID=UPI001C65FEC5|nr:MULTISPECIES: hypothetical protein [Shewanella]QYJ81704.1 hypothetical protein K0H80_15580 [Shewanella aegiceratis]QYJ93057.1 hypothetical protein K0I31_15865 [Shewanella spartinae]QYK12184.1 hypothetical protein K0I63_15770 [Shewanella rhizosphaerae]
MTEEKEADAKLIRLLKTCIVIGLCLILLGIYLHNFSETMEAMGVTGIIISAVCVAFGMVLSLPTKMYLTFILVKREAQVNSEAMVKPEAEKQQD